MVSTPKGVTTTILPPKDVLRIGRAPDADVVVADASVSRVHAILRAGTPPTVEDAGSRHGTVLFGRKLDAQERAPLMAGSILKLGAATLLIQATPDETASKGRPQDGPVAESAAMRELFGLIDVIAPSPLSVLVLGETGTGKEILARALHDHSPRASSPFIPLNCAALSEALLESELFGHEKGAFTGAAQTKIGLFEAADHGTIFLDEVGEMPLTTQAKLLRVLESGEVTRVGSVRPKTVDVRVVAATNRDLRELAAEKRFREDLLFRLDGVTLTLPPLRERPEDIPPLARRFAEAIARRMGRAVPELSDDALRELAHREWPGNVRELKHAVERAVTLRPEARELTASDFQFPSRSSLPPPAGPARSSPTLPPLRESVDAHERDRIVLALQQTSGNQTEAAKLLGIGRRTLIAKIEQHGIGRPRKGRDPGSSG